MALLTLTQLKSLLGVATAADDTQWTACIAAADAAVKSYLRWNPEQTTGAVYLDGTGTAELVLPGKPVEQVISEVRLDSQGGYGQISGSFDSTTVLTVGTHYFADTGHGILRMWRNPTLGFYAGGVGPTLYFGGLSGGGARPAYWPRVPGAVKVTMVNGYSAIPADLQLATAELAAWMKNYAQLGGLVSTSVSYIDVSVGLQAAAVEALGNVTLPAMGTVRAILSCYREPIVAGGIR